MSRGGGGSGGSSSSNGLKFSRGDIKIATYGETNNYFEIGNSSEDTQKLPPFYGTPKYIES